MKTAALALLAVVVAVACERVDTATTSPAKLTYPVAQKGSVVDDYHGTKVPDPYRWMEALDSTEVADWVAAENRVTAVLRGIERRRITGFVQEKPFLVASYEPLQELRPYRAAAE